jgi:hypothetical protein
MGHIQAFLFRDGNNSPFLHGERPEQNLDLASDRAPVRR